MSHAALSSRLDRKRAEAARRPATLTRDRLSRPASRLLDALSEPGALASPNPLEPGSLSVRAPRGGISVGRGLHPESSLRELVGRELVEAGQAPGSQPSYAITDVGRAYLRRAAAAPDEAYAAQHRELVRASPDADGGVVSLNAAESPLAWLRRRRGRDGEPLIDAASFEAGERLRRDITFAGMLPSVTSRWDGSIGGGGAALRDPAGATDAAIAARQRVRAAIEAIGPEFGHLLVDLCGFLKGLELIERERDWPPRSAKVVVRLALAQLARHYGLAAEATGPERSRGLRSWTAAEAAASERLRP